MAQSWMRGTRASSWPRDQAGRGASPQGLACQARHGGCSCRAASRRQASWRHTRSRVRPSIPVRCPCPLTACWRQQSVAKRTASESSTGTCSSRCRELRSGTGQGCRTWAHTTRRRMRVPPVPQHYALCCSTGTRTPSCFSTLQKTSQRQSLPNNPTTLTCPGVMPASHFTEQHCCQMPPRRRWPLAWTARSYTASRPLQQRRLLPRQRACRSQRCRQRCLAAAVGREAVAALV
mmetsp:Transcript_26088/g.56977  ORF Transcript_26088/g.56977 Transcript_26088/m.56977 type:complete len:234 (+) Transcript_26088:1075-1776(+)